MASKAEVPMHAYLLRGSMQLFAETRAMSAASGVSMAAFIRDAVSRALIEASARLSDERSDARSLPNKKNK
ncbi:hypothetical protein [Xanthomonas euvesicatoria]|uniref:hypothetical protein n=1 Tax=Xanthomonas euvesicatoria TaxID=456327 RepID=UPI0030C823F5